jgi:hypothetical protein
MVDESTKKTAAPAAASKFDLKGTFKVIKDAALKPMTAFKEHLPKYTDFKNAGILVLIIVVAMTILSTISSVVKVVRTEECIENCSMFSSKSEKKKVETKWNWDNLENYDWFETEGKGLIVNILVIAMISGAYFGMAQVFKAKDANFCRMAVVVALGMVPSAVLTFIAPVVGMINLTLGGIVGWLGIIYSIAIIFIGLNSEVKVEGDKKVYLNIASIACIALAYYIVTKLIYGDVAAAFLEFVVQAGSGSADPSGLLTSVLK